MSTTYRTLRRAVDDLVAAEDAVTQAREKHLDAQIKLGAALRAARERNGVSLRSIAKQLKLSTPYLSDVELGRRGISTGNLELLMGIIGPPAFTDIFEQITAAQKQPIPEGGMKIR